MSWMDIIHKAKTVSGTASKTANRLAPSELITGLPSQVLPQLDKNREQEMRAKENLNANLDARMKQINSQIKSKQLEIDNLLNEKPQGWKAKFEQQTREMNKLKAEASKQERQIMLDSGKKQRQAAGLSNNVKQILQNQGTKTPVQSVKNVELPARNVALPSVQGTTPTQDPLVGFAQERNLMPQKDPLIQTADAIRGRQQPTQNVTRPMGNVPLPDQVGRITDKANELGINREQMQQVVEQAKEQASPPSQRTGPPPKRMTTAQLNQQAQQRRQEEINEQNPYTQQQLDDAKLRQEAREKRAKQYLRDSRSPRQRKKAAKAKKKEEARQQKTQQRLVAQRQRDAEREAKRQAKQNPRGLVPKDSVPSQSRLVPRGQATPRSRLRPRNPPQPRPQVIKSELSKSIKDILRR